MDAPTRLDQPITAVWPGGPYPRGATWDGEGVNFALFAANATDVELCIFDPSGRHELQRIRLPEYTDEIWHGYLPEARPGLLYGYRVHGPYEPALGLRTSCCSIPTRKRGTAVSAGAMRISAIASGRRKPICRSTAATARPECRNHASSILRSRGATIARRARPGTTR
jgi:hypothetical protein